MTTEEKLQHFYDASIESAAKDAQHLKQEHQEALDKMFQEHKETKERQAKAQLQAESDNLKREINKTVSAKQLEYRRTTSARTEEIKKKIFDEVEAKLMQFKASPDYMKYLCERIQEALDFAGEDEMVIYIDPSDEACLPALKQHFGFAPSISREAWMGGMRAVIRSKNILIDNSFQTLLHDAKEEFVFTGGTADE
ncbi:MAG: Archaeal/vacuolar-type H+-ATPase subunit E [Clostridia bacterium]|nr:Archaeal/vacuolar-type H+-ATPase subunit E [Clostridia bacterium]NCC42782.1 Archaeal/vacuolar-type H+-ATPase subunit E [Clostridia bacterium]